MSHWQPTYDPRSISQAAESTEFHARSRHDVTGNVTSQHARAEHGMAGSYYQRHLPDNQQQHYQWQPYNDQSLFANATPTSPTYSNLTPPSAQPPMMTQHRLQAPAASRMPPARFDNFAFGSSASYQPPDMIASDTRRMTQCGQPTQYDYVMNMQSQQIGRASCRERV